jgi:hypothetical protein
MRLTVNTATSWRVGALTGGLTESITTRFSLSYAWEIVTKEAVVTGVGDFSQNLMEEYLYDIPK